MFGWGIVLSQFFLPDHGYRCMRFMGAAALFSQHFAGPHSLGALIVRVDRFPRAERAGGLSGDRARMGYQ